MSLVRTLGKVAVGIVVARGASKLMGGGNRGGQSSSQAGGLVDMLGGLMGGGQSNQRGASAGGLGDLLGGLMSGGQAGRSGANAGGGLGGLGGLLGGGAAAGGLGGLLGSLAGGNAQASGSGAKGLGDLFNLSMQAQEPSNITAEDEQKAELLLRAMINAAKADGKIDDEEQRKIMEHLGDATPDDLAFLRREVQAPLDVDGFIRSVPRGMEQEVYLMSLLAIKLDSQAEAQYLGKLVQGLNLTPQQANAIHQELGLPTLFKS